MGSSYQLAVAITSPSGDEFLVVRQSPAAAAAAPEKEEEYVRYVDSDLYDLPSVPLFPLAGGLRSEVAIDGADSVAGRLDLVRLDVAAALDQILRQMGLENAMSGKWKLLKYIEEAEFGPGSSVNSVFILGSLASKQETLQGSCKWMSNESASKLLSEVKPCSTRIGPYVYTGLLQSELSLNLTAAPALRCQEYPPGITLVPMKSKTLQPFCTTNLVVVLANKGASGSKHSGFAACGDALIIDPGCSSQVHAELADLVISLPKKLMVLVTHHHHDHIDGLSVVQRCNPDAVLLAHENTMNRIGKGNWSIASSMVTGGEKICIGDQQLEVVFAPGHTDGHLGVLHVNTNAVIVGDHCVGQGSAILDTQAGGNMKDYFQTTYRFLDLSPHVLIPMHGRINLWPKQMLCGYLRHRRARESSILQSIENGAQTLFDIVAKTYGDVDRKLWLPASSNVCLHVDHLNSQQKLPKDFSMEKFAASCGIHFISRWAFAYVQTKCSPAALAVVALGGGLAIAYALRKNNGN